MSLQLALDGHLRSSARGEYVATPAWFTHSLLRSAGVWTWDNRVLDAGAGLGEIGSEVHRWSVATRPGHGPRITGLELFPDRAAALEAPAYSAVARADLFDWAPRAQASGDTYHLILTNPPFSLWKRWIPALLPLLLPGGRLFALLPWEYVSRSAAFWLAHPAKAVYRSARRPWKNEIREACWVEFGPGNAPTTLRWLETGR